MLHIIVCLITFERCHIRLAYEGHHEHFAVRGEVKGVDVIAYLRADDGTK
jgi:hypothetical protein